MKVQEFFDPATFTLTYVVFDEASRDAVVIDPVLDFDPLAAETGTASVEKVISFAKQNALRVRHRRQPVRSLGRRWRRPTRWHAPHRSHRDAGAYARVRHLQDRGRHLHGRRALHRRLRHGALRLSERERRRALHVGSRQALVQLSAIKEDDGIPKAQDMIRRLVEAHETVARTAREIFKAAEGANDQPTCDLLTQRMQVHEKTAWMLRSLLE